jgi:hypothetical protein
MLKLPGTVEMIPVHPVPARSSHELRINKQLHVDVVALVGVQTAPVQSAHGLGGHTLAGLIRAHQLVHEKVERLFTSFESTQ